MLQTTVNYIFCEDSQKIKAPSLFSVKLFFAILKIIEHSTNFFLSVMPPKDLAPFSYISPQKS